MYDAHCSAMIQLFLVCLCGPWHIVCEKHVTHALQVHSLECRMLIEV